jgi:hypothetical protein
MKNNKFNQKEWFSAVYLASAMLSLPPCPEHNITENDLKKTAKEYLDGLIAISNGKAPTLSYKAQEITALLESFAVVHTASTGGGLQ